MLYFILTKREENHKFISPTGVSTQILFHSYRFNPNLWLLRRVEWGDFQYPGLLKNLIHFIVIAHCKRRQCRSKIKFPKKFSKIFESGLKSFILFGRIFPKRVHVSYKMVSYIISVLLKVLDTPGFWGNFLRVSTWSCSDVKCFA